MFQSHFIFSGMCKHFHVALAFAARRRAQSGTYHDVVAARESIAEQLFLNGDYLIEDNHLAVFDGDRVSYVSLTSMHGRA